MQHSNLLGLFKIYPENEVMPNRTQFVFSLLLRMNQVQSKLREHNICWNRGLLARVVLVAFKE